MNITWMESWCWFIYGIHSNHPPQFIPPPRQTNSCGTSPLSDRHMLPLYSISNYYLILPWRIIGIEGWLDYFKGFKQRQKRWYMKLCPQLVNKIVENYSLVTLERPLQMCSNNVGRYRLLREKKALIVVLRCHIIVIALWWNPQFIHKIYK